MNRYNVYMFSYIQSIHDVVNDAILPIFLKVGGIGTCHFLYKMITLTTSVSRGRNTLYTRCIKKMSRIQNRFEIPYVTKLWIVTATKANKGL